MVTVTNMITTTEVTSLHSNHHWNPRCWYVTCISWEQASSQYLFLPFPLIHWLWKMKWVAFSKWCWKSILVVGPMSFSKMWRLLARFGNPCAPEQEGVPFLIFLMSESESGKAMCSSIACLYLIKSKVGSDSECPTLYSICTGALRSVSQPYRTVL